MIWRSLKDSVAYKHENASANGRVAQWESARFTRERSLVRNQPRPCPREQNGRRGARLAHLRGGSEFDGTRHVDYDVDVG